MCVEARNSFSFKEAVTVRGSLYEEHDLLTDHLKSL